MTITTYTPTDIPAGLASLCGEVLCRQGSEMQAVFSAIASGNPDQADAERIAVATIPDPNGDLLPIGWASLCYWKDAPSIQASVHPRYRSRGLSSALVTSLTVTGDFPLATAAVFSPRLVGAARRAGFREVIEWQSTDEGWERVAN